MAVDACEGKRAALTLGPVLFNWQPERWRDFYFRIADEAPVATVYLGEAVCSKRAPLFEPHFEAVAERLEAAGKTVVLARWPQVISRSTASWSAECTARKASWSKSTMPRRCYHLAGRPHEIGPFMNVYNEDTVRSGAAAAPGISACRWKCRRTPSARCARRRANSMSPSK